MYGGRNIPAACRDRAGFARMHRRDTGVPGLNRPGPEPCAVIQITVFPQRVAKIHMEDALQAQSCCRRADISLSHAILRQR